METPMKTRASGIVLGLALTFGMLGCGLTGPDPHDTETLNLAGSWSGTIDAPPASAVATLTQNGSTIGGTITLSVAGVGSVSGTLSGSISGSVLTLTMSYPAGTYAPFGSATCSMTATETFVVTATSLEKAFLQNWSPSCIPTISSAATSFVQLKLTKQ